MTAHRDELEDQIAADVRARSAESEQIGRVFSRQHDMSAGDFQALLHVMVAETAGAPMTSGELRQRLGVSGAAVTYLVERMIRSGHLRRDADPHDRRKVMLRYDERGIATARAFFTPLAEHSHAALAGLPDSDLAAAHRVFAAMVGAMQAFQADLTPG